MEHEESVKKVLSCQSSGNFITAPDLRIKQINTEIMNQFLEATGLVWSVADLGPILGVAAFFYERDDEIDEIGNNTARQVKGRVPIGDVEFQKLKTIWGC